MVARSWRFFEEEHSPELSAAIKELKEQGCRTGAQPWGLTEGFGNSEPSFAANERLDF
jgi:hypothetical protein